MHKIMRRNYLKNIQIFRLIRRFLMLSGFLFLLFLMLSFTTLPYWGYHWLGTSRSELKWKPEVIILLGGSGMPSESNLIRSWFASVASHQWPGCPVLVAMPGDTADLKGTPAKMRNELVLRGVDAGLIKFAFHGTNTRSQALECLRICKPETSVILITSPEHMRRAVLTFRRAGFEKVNALPAFENAAEADFTYSDQDLGGRQHMVPGLGKQTQIRYQFWNHLKYEILVVRECAALAYYRLKGWI